MAEMNALDWIVSILLIIGGLNWGLVAMNFNLVEAIFGTGMLTTIIYVIVGLCAIYALIKLLMKKK